MPSALRAHADSESFGDDAQEGLAPLARGMRRFPRVTMSFRRRAFSIGVTLTLAGFQVPNAPLAWSQTTGGVPRTLTIASTSGRDLFEFYCASCHGPDGKGHGPVEQALKTPPPDLTAIAQRNGGQFPAARVEAILEGKSSPNPTAHGSSVMPIWGPIFRALDANDKANRVRLANLVRHLQSIQQVD